MDVGNFFLAYRLSLIVPGAMIQQDMFIKIIFVFFTFTDFIFLQFLKKI